MTQWHKLRSLHLLFGYVLGTTIRIPRYVGVQPIYPRSARIPRHTFHFFRLVHMTQHVGAGPTSPYTSIAVGFRPSHSYCSFSSCRAITTHHKPTSHRIDVLPFFRLREIVLGCCMCACLGTVVRFHSAHCFYVSAYVIRRVARE